LPLGRTLRAAHVWHLFHVIAYLWGITTPHKLCLT